MLKAVVGILLLGLAGEDASNQLAREIYKELIEIDTTDSSSHGARRSPSSSRAWSTRTPRRR